MSKVLFNFVFQRQKCGDKCRRFGNHNSKREIFCLKHAEEKLFDDRHKRLGNLFLKKMKE